jgi:hypothetical protein
MDSKEKETRPYSYRVLTEWSTSSSDGVWVLDSQIFPKSGPIAEEILSLCETCQQKWTLFDSMPLEILSTLQASKFVTAHYRIVGFAFPLRTRPSAHHSQESIELSLLKDAMLQVLAALPQGSLDESDERWGNNFMFSWKNAISSASDASMLMNCQILLEYGIKNAWLKPAGLKVMGCLPSRSHALRNATIGSVAIRLWMFDQCIRYEKVLDAKQSTESSGKGSSKSKKKH